MIGQAIDLAWENKERLDELKKQVMIADSNDEHRDMQRVELFERVEELEELLKVILSYEGLKEKKD